MSHLARKKSELKKNSSSNASHKKLFRWSIRACLIALLIAAPLIAPRKQVAQDICAKPSNTPNGSSQTCFQQASLDIAFMIDASGSIEQRGQTYNMQVEGVLRAINDPTVIPRDGTVAVSVIVFNEAANLAVPLTEIKSESDAKKVADIVANLKCDDIHSQQPPCPFGATKYLSPILTADINLSQERSKSPKPGVHRVFLMSTDGAPTDLPAALQRLEEARVAATLATIPFEMDVILVGLDTQSQEFQAANNIANQLATPKPSSSLPGATFVINAGECNQEGAAPDSPDCNRQANEFAEHTRNIIRGNVATIQLAVKTDTDTAPGAPVPQNGALSLRQAIEQANCNGGSAFISIDSALKGKTLKLSSPLLLTAPDIVINGCSGESCEPAITLDGDGQVSDGFVIRTNRAVIRGLKFSNFTDAAITIGVGCPTDTVGHNIIEQNTFENCAAGVVVIGDGSNERNLISRNNISRPAPSADSRSTALIDLGDDGPTLNDAGDGDEGPNTLLNFPDAMSVTADGDKVTVTGQLKSPPPNGSTVEIFAVTRFRVSENKIITDAVAFLGQATVDDRGNFEAEGLAPSPTGIYTATVTDKPPFDNDKDASSNTSELMVDSADTPLPRATAIVVNPTFGDVALNTPKTSPVTITNTGNAPLSVKGCSIGACPNSETATSDRFALTGCPTAPINPGQTVTLNVTFTPNACGRVSACLLLQTDDPERQQIAIELIGTGISDPRAIIQGGVSVLKFKKVGARGTPRNNPETLTFTVANAGCSAITLQSATLTRGGQTDDSGTFKVTPQGSQTAFPITVGAGNTVTFAVSFNPVIPEVAGSSPGIKDLLPSEIEDRLTIQVSAGNPVAITLMGSVKRKARLINPANTAAAPAVTICRSGNEFIVEFSAWDSNTNIDRALYRFRSSSGQPVGQNITVDLGQVIRERGIQRGQSFTVTQRFSGANDNPQVASVEVTIFDGGTSESLVSGGVSANCSTSAQTRRRARR